MLISFLTLAAPAFAHYIFPNLISGSTVAADWQYVRETNNFQDLGPVTDVTSGDLRCYDSAFPGTASTLNVAAGSSVGFGVYGNPASMYHPNVLNVYMAKAPSNVTGWAGDGAVWFKVYQITAVTNGGTTITFPAQNLASFTFTLPKTLPSGQYLLRAESIALHSASSFAGAQFYIGCAQINVTGGGSGKPGPLVSIPGVYTGNEPGILIDIYYPIPATYTQPGPAVWTG